jgi:phosphoribosylaminoimidazolecarboxamide formyltransferase/IMP cyclohydrolase
MPRTAKGQIKRALISVYDKTGIADFARALVDEFGVEVISTGGTAALLKGSGIPVTLVEHITGFPEIMDGRVKTLHPKIHAAILADRDNPEHIRRLREHDIAPIDMVVVNLYPFKKTVADRSCTFDQAIEMIDIGGPCLLRAAAKNHRHVLAVCDPTIARLVLEDLRRGEITADTRRRGALEAFSATCRYDAAIAEWLSAQTPTAAPQVRFIQLLRTAELRYGENPHQHADLYRILHGAGNERGLVDATGLDAAESAMSFNNYVDAAAAFELSKDLTREPAMGQRRVCVFVKHTNACGVGVDDDPIEAYRRAYLGDPNAAMGGILSCSFDISAELAQAVMETYERWGKPAGAGGFFVEVWMAPAFDGDARAVIRNGKKWGERVRLLAVGDLVSAPAAAELDYKKIVGGMLVQTRDLVGLNESEWKVVTRRVPTDSERSDLRLAWLICKHTKSNAITVCKDGMLLGNGAGQMSRVMSCRIATWLAKENGHAARLSGSAAASDAFFPFRDGPDILMDAGVTAIIQPGGSKRDADTIAACNERGVAMIFTGIRHFKH